MRDPIRTVRLAVAILSLTLPFAGCDARRDAGPAAASGSPGFERATWLGGQAVELAGPADTTRAVLFFDPERETSRRQARVVARLHALHPEVALVGATRSDDAEAIQAFVEATGFQAPIASGLDREAMDRFQVQQAPAIRVVGTTGTVVGRGPVALASHLQEPVRR